MKRFMLSVFALALVACGRSSQPPTPHLFGAPGGAQAPIHNTYWDTPAWFIDPANSTTCASDANNCTSSTCGAAGSGVGPCLTYAQIALGRWQTYSPRLNANVTITFLSSQPDGSDPIVAKPITNGSNGGNTGVTLTFAGTLVTVSSGTLSGTVAKVRSTNTPLQTTIGSPAINNLVTNTTRSSSAWVMASGTPSTISQPISGISLQNGPLPSLTAMTEDNGWADGNSYTQSAPTKVVFSQLQPDTTLCLQQEICGIALNNIYVVEPAVSNFGDDALYIGPFVWLANVFSERIIKLQNGSYGSDQVSSGMVNTGSWGFGGGFGITAYRSGNLPHGFTIYGGYIRSTTQTCVFDGVFIDFDYDINNAASGGPHCIFTGYNYIGAMRIGSSGLPFNTGIFDMRSFVQNGSTNVIWGAGNLDTLGQVLYPAGAGAAAAAFLTAGNPKILGGTLACLGVPSVATPTLTCNKTISAANLDADLGTTTGCYYVPGSGSYCNSGP